jgi:hypothetical protein
VGVYQQPTVEHPRTSAAPGPARWPGQASG